ncbi:hypothetical protein D3C80_1994050 [compost metagenome]
MVRADFQNRIYSIDIVGSGDGLAHIDLAQVFVAEIFRLIRFTVVVVMEQSRLAVKNRQAGHRFGG